MPEDIERRLDCNTFIKDKYSEICTQSMSGKRPTKANFAKARKAAIGGTALQAMQLYPDINPEIIWKTISRQHMQEFAGVDIDPEKLDSIVSARQSWVKSSGHAFEEMVKAECNSHLSDTNIVVLLQKDLSLFIKKNKISNGTRDINWLKSQCKTDVFDLYISVKDGDNYKIFGCIQAKTSVRDRVGRDLPASREAMDKNFWSIIFIFDADFLHQPKFKAMVNGSKRDSSGAYEYGEYRDNGWHQAFSYDTTFNEDRICYLGQNLEVFVNLAKQAAIDFTGPDRHLLTKNYPNE